MLTRPSEAAAPVAKRSVILFPAERGEDANALAAASSTWRSSACGGDSCPPAQDKTLEIQRKETERLAEVMSTHLRCGQHQHSPETTFHLQLSGLRLARRSPDRMNIQPGQKVNTSGS